MTIYRCDDSLESIFTAIYLSYEENRAIEDTCLALDDTPMLFAEDVRVEADRARAVKVMRTLERRFGEEDYLKVCMALASPDPGKAQAVYRTAAGGLDRRCARGHLFDDLADRFVCQAFELARKVSREISHLEGFLRFQELENGILYARMAPKCNVLTFLMPHFADRLPVENFVLYDAARNIFGIHPAGRQWYLRQGDAAETEPALPLSEEEIQYQTLFRCFCEAVSIRERENPQLQRSMLPLRFREYMIEFRDGKPLR